MRFILHQGKAQQSKLPLRDSSIKEGFFNHQKYTVNCVDSSLKDCNRNVENKQLVKVMIT